MLLQEHGARHRILNAQMSLRDSRCWRDSDEGGYPSSYQSHAPRRRAAQPELQTVSARRKRTTHSLGRSLINLSFILAGPLEPKLLILFLEIYSQLSKL